MDNEFIYLGTPQNETSMKSTKFREDRRVVTVRQSNVLLTSIGNGRSLQLVDQKGVGKVMSVKIVTDNPYVNVILEIDDWRNEGESPAGLLYGGTGKMDYGLYAMEGGDPAKGYTVMYTPQRPEGFERRFRVVVENRLPKTKIYGNNLRQTMPSPLPTPINNGFAGGSSFAAPLLASASTQTLLNAMAAPHFGDFYDAPVFNQALIDNIAAIPGVDHPFVGQAGKVTFTGDPQTLGGGATDSVIFFADPTGTFPNTSQVIYIVNQSDSAIPATTISSGIAVDDRLMIRDGGTLHFPGVVTNVAAVAQGSVPAEFEGQAAESAGIAVTVQPGLQVAPSSLQGGISAGVAANIGTITTDADTDPKILLKSVEIKYLLEVSHDG